MRVYETTFPLEPDQTTKQAIREAEEQLPYRVDADSAIYFGEPTFELVPGDAPHIVAKVVVKDILRASYANNGNDNWLCGLDARVEKARVERVKLHARIRELLAVRDDWSPLEMAEVLGVSRSHARRQLVAVRAGGVGA